MLKNDEVSERGAGGGGKEEIKDDAWMISIKAVGADIDFEGGGEMNSSGERQFTIQVSPDDYLESLHDQIEATTGLKASQQRLIYRGRLIGSQVSATPSPASSTSTATASAVVETPLPEKQPTTPTADPPGDLTLKTDQLKIKDIEGLADGQTIHLLKRRVSQDDSAINGRGRASAASTTTTRPRSSTVPLDGTSNDAGALTTGDSVSTGGLLATLLGLSSLTDENNSSDDNTNTNTNNNNNATRRWSRSRLGRSSRRAHYRMTEEDRQVPDPGSMEPVRQGLMTLHTLLPHLQQQSSEFENPMESNRRWYRGQWLDCLDTVNAWLEATVVEIIAPEDILPRAYDGVSIISPRHRREPVIHNDSAVSASDLQGRRRLLLEPCDPGDEHDLGVGVGDDDHDPELSGFRPRSTNHGVQLLLIHYNGWPHRWDEWIRSDSPRLRPFRTRTRHPNVSSTASPTPQSVFHEAPRTNILSTGDDDVDRVALLPELARVMASVNDVVQRQASLATIRRNNNESTNSTFAIGAPINSDVPWLSAVPTEPEATIVEETGADTSGESHDEISVLMQSVHHSNIDPVEDAFEGQNDDDSDSAPPIVEDEEERQGEQSSDVFIPAADEEQRLMTEHGARYNRQELQNLATLLDRLGRTLTDAAPHIASLAANLPSSDDDVNNEVEVMSEAIDHALEEIVASFRGDSEANANDTAIGAFWSLLSRPPRVSNEASLIDARIREPTRRPRVMVPPSEVRRPAVDPDHEDFVSGLVNTTRGEVRTGPRSRSSNDEVANLLGAYLAAATLGNGSSSDGDRDDGATGLGQLLRGGVGGGGGIDIHIHAVVTGPGGTFGAGTGGTGNTTILGGTTPVGGPRNLFSSNRRTNAANSINSNAGTNSNSLSGGRRQSTPPNEDDLGIFDELYSETPAPIDPSTPSQGNTHDATTSPVQCNSMRAPDLHDPDMSESTSGGDYITGLNVSARPSGGSGSPRSLFGATAHHQSYATPERHLAGRNLSLQMNSMDSTNVGAATLAGRGVSSTIRRRPYRGSFRRSNSFEDRYGDGRRREMENPQQQRPPRMSGLGRLFRRGRSTRLNSTDEQQEP